MVNISLTKDDVNKVITLFSNEREVPNDTVSRGAVVINYFKMSLDMGLQKQSLN